MRDSLCHQLPFFECADKLLWDRKLQRITAAIPRDDNIDCRRLGSCDCYPQRGFRQVQLHAQAVMHTVTVRIPCRLLTGTLSILTVTAEDLTIALYGC